MNREPVLLAAPAVLHADDRYTVWHAGVVLGPPGLVVVNLTIAASEQHQTWGPPDGQPVEAYIETPALPWRMVGENGYAADWYTLQFHGRFPSQLHGKRASQPLTVKHLTGATLHIEIHPLSLRFTIDMSPPTD